jgi:glucose/arabinose dehydrogenase
MKKFLLAIFTLALFSANAQTPVQTTLISGLQYSVAFTFLPDGKFLITLKPGVIALYDAAGVYMNDYYDLSDSTYDNFERGLLGIEIDPNYATNNYVYAYYNHRCCSPNFSGTQYLRVVRFTTAGNVGTNPMVIFSQQVGNINGNHVGGNVRFRPSDTANIYISIGDIAVSANAQQLTNPFGKMLRLKKDGTIPTNNPFYDDGNPATGNDDRIWSYGHRNPFDFCFSTFNDSLYISENGVATWDEVNYGIRGGNYGWSPCEGFYVTGSTTTLCNNPNYIDPIEDWGSPLPAITGILHYTSNLFNTLTNHLLVSDNDYGRIYDITLGNAPLYDTFISRTQWMDAVPESGGLTTLKQGADGCVYAMKGGYTTSGKIYRICPQGLYTNENAQQNFFISQATPNPFNAQSLINFNLKQSAQVKITVTDVTSKTIAIVLNESKQAGEHTITISKTDLQLTSGIYFCTMQINGGEYSQTIKLVVQ